MGPRWGVSPAKASQGGVWSRPPGTPGPEEVRAEWHAKARSADLSLSALVRLAIGRTCTWTAPRADLERARLVQLARIRNNLNQIARWASRVRMTQITVRNHVSQSRLGTMLVN